MKKIVTITLLFIFAGSTMGIGITQFYCCGHLKSTSISFSKSDNSNSAKNHAISCCKSTIKNLKLQDNYIGSDYIFSSVKSGAVAVLFTSCHNEKQSLNLMPHFLRQSLSPPPNQGVPIYIFDCVYRM
jgi:hypothetical protein